MSHAPAPVLAVGMLLAALPAVGFGQDDAAAGTADGPEREFLAGLRDRGLADFALVELDRLAADPEAPAEVKAALPYERALALLALARGGSGGAADAARLDQASALLESFAEANPDNPLAGDAQFLRAEILQTSAASLLGGGDPAALPDAAKTQARRLLEEAGRVYASARRKLEKTLREIGPFVEQGEDAARARRDSLEAKLIRARIEGARVTFLRASTYPLGDPQRDQLLTEADGPLEEVRDDFRRKIGALPGRIVQGQIRTARVPDDPAAVAALADDAKAAAKQELNTATSIFQEVVDQEPPRGAGSEIERAVEDLRGTAQRLRLAVLNHPLKADHATAVTQATQWLEGPRSRAGTDSGAGVLYERGVAQENLAAAAEDREQTRLLRAALADYQTAARRSEAVRPVASLAADRVRGALGLDRAAPRTFDEAFERAQTLIRQRAEKLEAVQTAEGDAAKAAAQEDLDALYAEAADLLTAALDLADGRTPPADADRARFFLAFVDVQLGRYYEAAVLAEFVARNFRPSRPDPKATPEEAAELAEGQKGIPLEAASTAALAWTKAYQDRPAGTDGAFELAQLGQIADFIAENYPDSDRASAARVTLGRVLLGSGELEDAAAVFATVPPTDPGYADAQLQAGDSLWRRFVELRNAPTPPPGSDPEAIKTQARERLRTGVDKAAADLSGDAETPSSLTVGRVTLAQLLNGEGEFQTAADLLTTGKAPVTEAIKAEGDRPARGVKSAAFAGLALQQLLRAQIGLKQLGPAKETMATLESVGTGGNTAVFVSLGKQIQQELDALPEGPQKTETRQGLVSFLDQIAASGEQTFGSRMWVAETYNGLAESLPGGDRRATDFFAKGAAALNGILSALGTDGFLPADADRSAVETAVRLRLAEVSAGAGKFAEGYEEVKRVLAAKPNALNAQQTAADLLADWGESTGDAERLEHALRGEGPAWGWGKLSKMLADQLRRPNSDRFRDDYNASQLRIAAILQQLAETKSGDERTGDLATAERQLLTWVTTTDPAEIAPERRREAKELYADLQKARGVAVPAPLPDDPNAVPPAAPAGTDGTVVADTGGAAGPVAKAPEIGTADEDGGPSVPLLVGLLVLLGLGTAGAVWMFKPKPRKRAARRAGSKAAAAGGSDAKRGRGAVRDSLPAVAPVPAAAPAKAADSGLTGTGFPDFSALPKKGAGTAVRTRTGTTTGGPRKAGTSGSAAAKAARPSSSSGSSRSASSGSSSRSADGKTVRRSSSSGPSSSGSPDAPPRKPRPKPPAE